MENGFEQDDVAALLGDSPDVARIYARVTNKRLERKIMEKFGTHQ
jgi:hypothetical protein